MAAISVPGALIPPHSLCWLGPAVTPWLGVQTADSWYGHSSQNRVRATAAEARMEADSARAPSLFTVKEKSVSVELLMIWNLKPQTPRRAITS